MAAQLLTWNEYAARWASLHGGVDPRRGSPWVRRWLRIAYSVGRALSRLRVTPTAVTVSGLVLSLLVPAFAAQQGAWLIAAAGAVLLSAVADSADGAVAMITSRATRLGYLYDSVVDRISEASWLVAFWLVGAPGWLVALTGAVTWLHEYVRARAAAAGMTKIGVVTVAERPTRVALVAVGLGVGGAAGLAIPALASGTVTVALAVWAVLGLLGLAQLFGAVRLGLRSR